MDQRLRAGRPTGGADAHDSLRKVRGYVHSRIIEGACLRLPLTRDSMGTDVRLISAQAHEQLTTMPTALTTEVRRVSETS